MFRFYVVVKGWLKIILINSLTRTSCNVKPKTLCVCCMEASKFGLRVRHIAVISICLTMQ